LVVTVAAKDSFSLSNSVRLKELPTSEVSLESSTSTPLAMWLKKVIATKHKNKMLPW
jgi:hypothetical protein